jgi:hypothetical protein
MAINSRNKNGELIRELANRPILGGSGGFVALYWNSESEEIFLHVEDGEDNFDVRDIPKDRALDALNHPYAYADAALVGKLPQWDEIPA